MKEGVFKTVKCAYGNHLESVLDLFLSNGWAVKSQQLPDCNKGQIYHYITFVSGVDAVLPEIEYPNAKVL